MDLKIKVCGMASPENAAEVSALAPDYMGFIFHERSPRNALSLLPKVVRNLPKGITPVGVFVNRTNDEIFKWCEKYGISTVQLHGAELPSQCAVLKAEGFTVWKAVGISADVDLRILELYRDTVDSFLFDTKSPDYGGTGIKYDWDVLSSYDLDIPFLLSGGIAPGDVEAIGKLDNPMLSGVDLNSRFELSPGLKDINLLQNFINSLRNYEQNTTAL